MAGITASITEGGTRLNRDQPARIGIVLYDGVEPIDLGGTLGVISMASRLLPGLSAVTIAARAGPVRGAGGLTVLAAHGFADVPQWAAARDVARDVARDGARDRARDGVRDGARETGRGTGRRTPRRTSRGTLHGTPCRTGRGTRRATRWW